MLSCPFSQRPMAQATLVVPISRPAMIRVSVLASFAIAIPSRMKKTKLIQGTSMLPDFRLGSFTHSDNNFFREARVDDATFNILTVEISQNFFHARDLRTKVRVTQTNFSGA